MVQTTRLVIYLPLTLDTAGGAQAEAERRKRAQILESEGQSQSKINVAEARKMEVILGSEAARQDSINRAIGERAAKSLLARNMGISMIVYIGGCHVEAITPHIMVLELRSENQG